MTAKCESFCFHTISAKRATCINTLIWDQRWRKSIYPISWCRFPTFSELDLTAGHRLFSRYIQLLRERRWERLSEKVHAPIPKGIVGGFKFMVLERMAGEAMGVCLRVLKESNKSRFDSYSVRNSVLIMSHITYRDCRVHTFFRQPFSK